MQAYCRYVRLTGFALITDWVDRDKVRYVVTYCLFFCLLSIDFDYLPTYL